MRIWLGRRPPITRDEFNTQFAGAEQCLLLRRGTDLRILFEKRDDLGAYRGIIDAVEQGSHVVAWDHRTGIGDPLIKRLLVPDDVRALDRIRVVEPRHHARLAPDDAIEARS